MTTWRRPTACGSAANCAEVAHEGDRTLVRQTSRPSVILRFTRAEWDAFLTGVRNGEFDAPTDTITPTEGH